MKVIYIFWNERLNEQRGGIHRIVLLLLRYLSIRGFDIHYLYTLDDYKTFYLYNVDQKREDKIPVDKLREYLIKNKCNIILGQDASFSSTLTELVHRMSIPNVKFINQYHCSFLHIPKKLSIDYLRFEYEDCQNVVSKFNIILKLLFYPLWKKYVWKNLTSLFRYNYLNSDISLLLTQREEPILRKILHGESTDKCAVISNPLSWEKIEASSILKEKKKEVLIVSRLYNPEKRIDLVLKVWRILQDRGVVNDWTLRIVGDGIHKKILMKMAEDMHLKNVLWEGWSDPKPFYRTSSLFMMTSACEGWGLTLTESMQTGVVPLAIDTYPALHDIITDGYDGYIIKKNDTRAFANRMQYLMQNPEYREQIALNALKSCCRFSVENVMDKWCELLNSL